MDIDEINGNILLNGGKLIISDRGGHYGGLFKGSILIIDGSIEEITRGDFPPERIPKDCQKIDLNGSIVSPAFYDAHMHLYQWSISRMGIDLSKCRSDSDVLYRIGEVTSGKNVNSLFEESGIILGIDYDDSLFNGRTDLNRRSLDRAFPDNPCIIRRVCGHTVIMNTMALDLLGEFWEEEENGILRESSAMDSFWEIPFERDLISTSFKEASILMNGFGVIGGVDILPGDHADQLLSILKDMDNMSLTLSITNGEEVEQNGQLVPEKWNDVKGDPKSNGTIGFEKFFLDGSIGSRTASFKNPYLDADPKPPLIEKEDLKERLSSCYKRGRIPMIHAIGDRAVEMGTKVAKGFDLPFRIEHAERISDPLFSELRESKIALCMQPNFQDRWGRKGGLYEMSLGNGILLNRFRSVLRSGLPLCFGTDMMPPGPLKAMRGAVDHPYGPERLSYGEAVISFSLTSKWLSYLGVPEQRCLERGSTGDLVVYNKGHYVTELTIIGGRIIHNGKGKTI